MTAQASNQSALVPHAQGLPLTVSNAEFLQAIFGPDFQRAHVTAFKDSPDAIAEDARGRCWAGGPFQRLARRINAGQNAYMTISLFRPDPDGKAKRQKVLFERAGCIVVDDVGTKVTDTARLPPPSWRLETSPDNEQWGYILEDPNASQERVSGLLSAMVANGLCPDGKDPGMKGVTRYVRLPEGSNLKLSLLKKLGPAGWRCRLQEWQPERKFTVNELMRPFGITEADLAARSDQTHSSAPSLVTSSDDPVLRVISDAGMYKGPAGPGWHNVTCPNLDAHTSQDDSGSAVFVGADGTYGYQCHHGHCEGMKFAAFVQRFDKETGGTAMRDTLWEEQLKSAAEDFAEPLPGAADVVMPAAESGNLQVYKLLTAAELRALPPQRYRIRGVLPEKGFGAFVGASTAGKTFAALDVLAHISLGIPWHGFKTYQAPVVYVGLEGEQGIRQRVQAWELHYGVSLPETFRFVLQPFNMLQLANVSNLAAAVLAAGGHGGVVVIDTLNRAAPGADENSSVDMGNIIAAAKKLQSLIDGLVMLVHHKGKSDAAGARGHSSLYGALDAAIAVNNVAGKRSWSTSPDQGGKSKDGEAITRGFDLATVMLGCDAEGLPVSSAVVVPSEGLVRAVKPLTTAQLAALDAFYAAAIVYGALDASGEFAGLHAEAWRPEFYKTSIADNLNAKKTAFQRVRKDLLSSGYITVSDDVYRLAGDLAYREAAFTEALRVQKGSK